MHDDIYASRFDPEPTMILWTDRDRMGDTYYNLYEDGNNPFVSDLMKDDFPNDIEMPEAK